MKSSNQTKYKLKWFSINDYWIDIFDEKYAAQGEEGSTIHMNENQLL